MHLVRTLDIPSSIIILVVVHSNLSTRQYGRIQTLYKNKKVKIKKVILLCHRHKVSVLLSNITF